MFFGLPDSDKVFTEFFDRWYKPEDRQRKMFPATRPDIVQYEKLSGRLAKDVSPIIESAQAEAKRMIDGMIEAARESASQAV